MARPVIVAPSQMKKGPEAVILGPIPQDAQAVSLRLRPTLCRRPQSFFRRTRLMIAFRRHFSQSASPSSGRWANPARVGQGGVLKITLLNDTQP